MAFWLIRTMTLLSQGLSAGNKRKVGSPEVIAVWAGLGAMQIWGLARERLRKVKHTEKLLKAKQEFFHSVVEGALGAETGESGFKSPLWCLSLRFPHPQFA